MRRTRGVLGALVLSGVVVLTGAGVASADAPSPVPTATKVPSPEPSVGDSTKAPGEPSAVPSVLDPATAPIGEPARDSGQVSVVPRGAADTGVGEPSGSGSSGSGSSSTALVGAGAGAVLLAGGAFVVVRRRRATGE
ncbi:LPXTG cell wall anchor domain-containing protein [Streptomyces acidiscabies]|uniref:LPXTG cell wall anchor domain-containing protein n=1 Tax=Streptomyces acidiscabies TaxID=42234 RepID=UPI0038F7664E